MNLYEDHDLLATTMRECISRGETVFQIHRLAATEQDHVAELLRYINPPKGATILDLGCGIGTVAKMMHDLRPDLKFILLNNSQLQLDLAHELFRKECRSFHELAGLNADVVMMQYALGHAEDLVAVMESIASVLPVGGSFFLYDMTSMGAPRLKATLNYTAWPKHAIRQAAVDAGLEMDWELSPRNVWVEHFYNKMPQKQFRETFVDVWPWMVRFTK